MILTTAVGISHQTILVESVSNAIVTAVSCPDAATFSDLTVKTWKFPTAQTPTVTVRQSAPGVGTMRVRMAGWGPHNEWVEEITPTFGITAKAVNQIYLGAIFKWVEQVSYIAAGMTVGATIEVGMANDLARVGAAGIEHIAPANLGFWIPGQRASRLGPRPGGVCDPNEPQLLQLSAFNKTTSRTWIESEVAGTLGYSESGWGVADDKLGVDITKFNLAQGGGAVSYTPGDSVELYVTTRSKP